jgi:hypothetical protein
MSGIGAIEVLLVLVVLVLPVVIGLRNTRGSGKPPASTGFVAAAWVAAVGTFVFPLAFVLAFPMGGEIVGRGRRQGWAVMGAAALAALSRVAVAVSR